MNILDSKNNLEFGDYFRILAKRKWYFILLFVLVLSLGILKIVTKKPQYESSCTIQIERSRLLSSDLERVVPSVVGPEEAVGLQKRIKSRDYLIKLARRLDLQNDKKIRKLAQIKQMDSPDKSVDEILEILLVEQMKRMISVFIYGRDIVEIKAKASTPDLAYAVVKTLTDIFVEESLRLVLSNVKTALDFNQQQISVYKKKLEEAERELAKYEKSLLSKAVSDQRVSNKTIDRFKEAIMAVEMTLKEKKDYEDYLTARISKDKLPHDYPKTTLILKIQGEMEKQVKQLADLLKRYSTNNQEVIKVNRNINQLRDRINEEIKKICNSKYANLDMNERVQLTNYTTTLFDLHLLETKKYSLNHEIEKITNRTAENTSEELTLSKLRENVAINKKIYNMFVEQNQGVLIEESMRQADATSRFKIIEAPFIPLESVGVSKKMILLVTLVLGMGLGMSAVYLRELLDKSIPTVQEAEELFDIPVLGVMPYIDFAVQKRSKGRKIFITVTIILVFGSSILVFYYLSQLGKL